MTAKTLMNIPRSAAASRPAVRTGRLADPTPNAPRVAVAPSLSDYFDDLYRSDDPYGTGNRWYERRKRQLLLDSLPRLHFRVAFEPACGTGELTRGLAARCGEVFASDFCEAAIHQARSRTHACPNVRLAVHRVPEFWATTPGLFDLVVLSELCSFLNAEEVARVATCCGESLAADGVLVACDWRWPFEGRVLDAETAHHLLEQVGLRRTVRHEEEDFLLTIWTRDGHSVARQDGIIV